jgi:hypothetical protein
MDGGVMDGGVIEGGVASRVRLAPGSAGAAYSAASASSSSRTFVLVIHEMMMPTP